MFLMTFFPICWKGSMSLIYVFKFFSRISQDFPSPMESEPPLLETYKTLFQNNSHEGSKENGHTKPLKVEECKLPLIDLSRLNLGHEEREKCKKEIANASSNWGFFQVVNHGVPRQVMKRMQFEQKKVFHQPFNKKAEQNFLNLPANSYRWGNPLATSQRQFPWSEAFHIPLIDLSRMEDCHESSLRSTIEVVATKMASLAKSLAEILTENLGVQSTFFQENCTSSTCYLRMNRYPPCPIPPEVLFGFMPHTDSDFLTILNQDQVGGLQLVRNGIWFNVKPISDALVINIGDLFQAWSNGTYKSVEHRVLANGEMERFSVAYFYCPYQDTVIKSSIKPSIYRKFSFREYKQQILEDVKVTGNKIGLSRFLL